MAQQSPATDGTFPIISLHREDLEEKGYDISSMSDEKMQSIAKKMHDNYLGLYFWTDLIEFADQIGVKFLSNGIYCPHCACQNPLLVRTNSSGEVQCENCGYSETQ